MKKLGGGEEGAILRKGKMVSREAWILRKCLSFRHGEFKAEREEEERQSKVSGKGSPIVKVRGGEEEKGRSHHLPAPSIATSHR